MTVFLLNLSLMALWVASTGAFSYANSALGFLVGVTGQVKTGQRWAG
jgi:multisubunit Na+/H+ antiporter MnhE subunit